MKCSNAVFASAVFISAAGFVRADPTDEAIVAAMKLSTVINYSWSTTISEKSRSLEIHGKTSADGYSLLTFTGYAAGAGASTARSGTGGGVNTVFLGDSKYVVENNGNWVTPGSAASAGTDSASNAQSEPNPAPASATRGKRSRGGIGGSAGGANSGSRRSSAGNDPDSTSATTGRPKLPAGVNLPHEELAIIAANYTDMHSEGGVVTGKLTDWGADLLLSPPGWTQSPPDNAGGTFRLWLKDGAVTKYELKLKADNGPGGVAVAGGINQTITVELTDIGTTQVEVPAAAKLKLSK
jgi:hypothetical protein